MDAGAVSGSGERARGGGLSHQINELEDVARADEPGAPLSRHNFGQPSLRLLWIRALVRAAEPDWNWQRRWRKQQWRFG